VVLGNLTVPNSNSTVTAVYNGQLVLNVSGVANLHGTLLLVLGNNTNVSNSAPIVLGYALNLTHQFDHIEFVSSNGCVRYGTTAFESSSLDSTEFGVLIASENNSCRHSGGIAWWVYVVIVVGVLLLVAAMIGLLYFLDSKGLCRSLFHSTKKIHPPQLFCIRSHGLPNNERVLIARYPGNSVKARTRALTSAPAPAFPIFPHENITTVAYCQSAFAAQHTANHSSAEALSHHHRAVRTPAAPHRIARTPVTMVRAGTTTGTGPIAKLPLAAVSNRCSPQYASTIALIVRIATPPNRCTAQ